MIHVIGLDRSGTDGTVSTVRRLLRQGRTIASEHDRAVRVRMWRRVNRHTIWFPHTSARCKVSLHMGSNRQAALPLIGGVQVEVESRWRVPTGIDCLSTDASQCVGLRPQRLWWCLHRCYHLYMKSCILNRHNHFHLSSRLSRNSRYGPVA